MLAVKRKQHNPVRSAARAVMNLDRPILPYLRLQVNVMAATAVGPLLTITTWRALPSAWRLASGGSRTTLMSTVGSEPRTISPPPSRTPRALRTRRPPGGRLPFHVTRPRLGPNHSATGSTGGSEGWGLDAGDPTESGKGRVDGPGLLESGSPPVGFLPVSTVLFLWALLDGQPFLRLFRRLGLWLAPGLFPYGNYVSVVCHNRLLLHSGWI